MMPVASSMIYVGRHQVRIGGGRSYVHIPLKTAGGLLSKKVRVVALVNADKCEDKSFHSSIIMFSATLVRVGETYRINLPSYYAELASRISNCGSLDIWLMPIG